MVDFHRPGHIHIDRYIHIYIHTYIHTYTHIHTYIHTYIYIHTYVHTYTYTYIPRSILVYNSPRNKSIDLLQLLLHILRLSTTSSCSELVVERSHVYGAGYYDNWIVFGLLLACYMIALKKIL